MVVKYKESCVLSFDFAAYIKLSNLTKLVKVTFLDSFKHDRSSNSTKLLKMCHRLVVRSSLGPAVKRLGDYYLDSF